MRGLSFTALAAITVSACASSGTLHNGPTALHPEETTVVARSTERSAGGFRRVWRAPGLKPFGLIKWDQDRSVAAPPAPADLLQVMRDELGRVNQRRAKGDDVVLTVTVYAYDAGGWFSQPSAHYELVARNKKGQAVWAVDDEIAVRRDLALTLVDSDEVLLARELVTKIRQEFGI